MVAFAFLVLESWPLDCAVFLFCVIYVVVPSLTYSILQEGV